MGGALHVFSIITGSSNVGACNKEDLPEQLAAAPYTHTPSSSLAFHFCFP